MSETPSSFRRSIEFALFRDGLVLKRTGDLASAASLDYLCDLLRKAVSYDCGEEEKLQALRTSDPPPTLFDSTTKELKALPHPDLFLQYRSRTGLPKAALVSNRRGKGLEVFIFRFDEKRQRWIWPLTGVRYGPSPEDLDQIAVLDPRHLKALSPQAKSAMIQENARNAGPLIAALEEVRSGRSPYLENVEAAPFTTSFDTFFESQDNEEKPRPRKATISPSSFAQKARTRHRKTCSGKGRRRS